MTSHENTSRRTTHQLRTDAVRIWRAGVDAVNAELLVRNNIFVENDALVIVDELIPLESIGRIVVIGAGKAGAGMASGVEQALGNELADQLKLCGMVNVPENCVRKLRRIQLHPGRPAGLNEPTQAGVDGTRHMLRLIETLRPDDLCICLISGGGSALMPMPVEQITLDDKLAVTRTLSAAGANIDQMNTVRKHLSRIKGGGLRNACRNGRMIGMIISDVLGDPLDLIASGPTVTDPSTPRDALRVLQQFDARQLGVSDRVFDYLEEDAETDSDAPEAANPNDANIANYVIGNIATAIDAAGLMAEQLGYSHAMVCAHESEGQAEDVGRHLARNALRMRGQPGPDCLISGGEPVVRLTETSRRGLGGRNQQLVLAALEHIRKNLAAGVTILSGGTDGEDGPTDAAGAIVDDLVLDAVDQLNLNPDDYMERNDAYHFFEQVGTLLKTGPTHTNVCDIRVVLTDRIELDVR